MGNGTLCEPNPCVSRVGDETAITPLSLTATPNPSIEQVIIRYSLPKPSTVSIEVFNAAGALVRRFDEGQRPAGSFTAPWDGRDGGGRELPTGVYFARIVTEDGTIMTHVVLTR
jgi:flagellar hook assembly protein FlgD